MHSPKTAVVRVAPKLAAHQPFYSFTKEVVSRSEVTQKVGEISLLLCQDILSFLLGPCIKHRVLLVIQLFIMEPEESRKLKESSTTVTEAGYVFSVF